MKKNPYFYFGASGLLAGFLGLASYFLKVFSWGNLLPPQVKNIEEYLFFYKSTLVVTSIILTISSAVLAAATLAGVFIFLNKEENKFFAIAGLISGSAGLLILLAANLLEMGIYQIAAGNQIFFSGTLAKINAAFLINFSDILLGGVLVLLLIFYLLWAKTLAKNKNFWLGITGWLMLIAFLNFAAGFFLFQYKLGLWLNATKLTEIILNSLIFVFFGLGLLTQKESMVEISENPAPVKATAVEPAVELNPKELKKTIAKTEEKISRPPAKPPATDFDSLLDDEEL